LLLTPPAITEFHPDATLLAPNATAQVAAALPYDALIVEPTPPPATTTELPPPEAKFAGKPLTVARPFCLFSVIKPVALSYVPPVTKKSLFWKPGTVTLVPLFCPRTNVPLEYVPPVTNVFCVWNPSTLTSVAPFDCDNTNSPVVGLYVPPVKYLSPSINVAKSTLNEFPSFLSNVICESTLS